MQTRNLIARLMAELEASCSPVLPTALLEHYRHYRRRGASRARSFLFPLNLHISFHGPDLVLGLRVLVTWRGKLVWN